MYLLSLVRDRSFGLTFPFYHTIGFARSLPGYRGGKASFMVTLSEFDIMIIVSLAWGIAWAATLQWWPLFRFLAQRRTWITVVIGVGVQVVIFRIVGPSIEWGQVLAGFVASGTPIAARSLANEAQEETALTEGFGNG